MFHLLKAVPDQAVLILVGDVFQLPSVGPGNVLSDFIQSEKVPVVQLNRIFRQGEGSLIVVNAHRIHQGDMPILVKEEGNKIRIFISWIRKSRRRPSAGYWNWFRIGCPNDTGLILYRTSRS